VAHFIKAGNTKNIGTSNKSQERILPLIITKITKPIIPFNMIFPLLSLNVNKEGKFKSLQKR